MQTNCVYNIDGKRFTKDEFLSYVKRMELSDVSKIIPQITSLHSAPFITETKGFVKLGLKVAIQQAALSDVKYLSWMTGEQENSLYDLSKSLSKISWWQVGDDEFGYGITTYSKQNEIVLKERDIDLKQIEKIVGKDVAEKIKNGVGYTNSVGQARYGEIVGDDLKLSGSGMIGFYGSVIQNKEGIVGSVLKSLVKELTGKPTEINTIEIETFDINVLKEPSREITVENTYVEKAQNKYLLRSKSDNKIVADGSLSWRDNFYSDEDHHADLVVSANKYPIDFGKKTSTQPSIEITPELKKAVDEGLPMFKVGGQLKAKNPYSICTVSLGRVIGTQKRSKWTSAQLNKYERCVLKVKKTMRDGGDVSLNDGGQFTVLYKISDNKYTVYSDKDGYVITINNPDDAKYVELWYRDKRVGVLHANEHYLNDYHGHTGKFLSIQSAYIDNEHQNKGFGLKMYQVLKEFSADDVLGFFSDLDKRQNKKVIPKIYSHFDNEIVGDYHIVTYVDGGIVDQTLYFAIYRMEEGKEHWYMVGKHQINDDMQIETVIGLIDKAVEDEFKVKAITKEEYENWDLGDEITTAEPTKFFKDGEISGKGYELEKGGSLCKCKFEHNRVPSKSINEHLLSLR